MSLANTTLRMLGLGALAFSILPGPAEASPSHSSQDQSYSSYEEVIKGRILKADSDRIVVRTKSGERMTLNITDDTRMKCKKDRPTNQANQLSGSGSSTSASSTSPSSSSGMAQSAPHNQATSTGFRFGNCDWEKGDRIRAKVDDAGDVVYLTGRSRGKDRHDNSYSFTDSIPDHYLVLPAGAFGGMGMESAENRSILKTKDGEKIGKIIKLLSTDDGDLAYAIVRKDDGHLVSVPWDAITQSSGSKTSTLDIRKDQLTHLPILGDGETSSSHIATHWDLNSRDRGSSLHPHERAFGRVDFESNRAKHNRDRRYQRDIYEQDFGRDSDRDDIDYSWRDRDYDTRYDRGSRSGFERRRNIHSQSREGKDDRSSFRKRERQFQQSRKNRYDDNDNYDYRPSRYRAD